MNKVSEILLLSMDKTQIFFNSFIYLFWYDFRQWINKNCAFAKGFDSRSICVCLASSFSVADFTSGVFFDELNDELNVKRYNSPAIGRAIKTAINVL